MSVALAGNTPATFEIKSASLPLVALLLKSPDLSVLEREMATRFGDIPDFFDNDPLIIDLAPLKASQPDAVVDFEALLPLLRMHRLQPLVVRGGSPAQMEAAAAAGLVPTAEAVVPRRSPAGETEAPPRPRWSWRLRPPLRKPRHGLLLPSPRSRFPRSSSIVLYDRGSRYMPAGVIWWSWPWSTPAPK